ncbi:MAG: hypothetical protein AABW67_05025 [Nanoarchaeota archaeon]
MKIGIDIDGVILDFASKFLEYYNKKHRKNISIENWITYNFWDFISISEEEGKKLMEDFYFLDSFNEIPFIEGSKEAIHKLAKQNKIYIITARPLRWGEKTKNFFDKHFLETDIQLIHSRDEKDKTIYKREICIKLGVSILIEDNGNIAIQCADSGIKVLLLNNPWNQGIEHKNINRIKNWNEILNKIQEIDKLNNQEMKN